MASWGTITRAAAAAAVLLLMLRGIDPAASAPVSIDPINCLDSGLKCCPPPSYKEIVDFKPDSQPTPLRIRRPAHTLDAEAAQKYEKAIALMRALPRDHPWNFIQQSNVHCAYCSGGHVQLGTKNVTIEIHGSWHFFTWHRAYLYFYERILGKLINDASFAIPFWNWDDLAGMSIPTIYRDNTSSLFNPTRYPTALNFTNLGGCEGDGTPGSLDKQKLCNLQVMHRQFAAASNSTSIFFGGALRAGGGSFPGGSPIENSPHSPVHVTTGADMSQISKSGYDPLFIAHHSNVDRLWAIWEGIPGKSSKVIADPDFLDASFLFWDENLERVRIRVRDVIDPRKLGYVYQDVPLKWMDIKTRVEDETSILQAQDLARPYPVGKLNFPLRLRSAAKVNVRRTASRGETLVVSDIELDGRDYVWFDIYVSRVDGGGRAQAGCFIHMERRSDKKIPIITKMQIGIADVIKQIGAAADDQIVVTLEPKVGGDKVTVGGVSII
ncbi:hypothetical protein KSP39_PZI022441 [Platanthera zijinensis]|uniref:Tyrosinase copper-binding domain-containing protein n=1 Tax=Platanthera zijinensis TaxID=2320716 RepID=A0AAP0FV86_9ASPA